MSSKKKRKNAFRCVQAIWSHELQSTQNYSFKNDGCKGQCHEYGVQHTSWWTAAVTITWDSCNWLSSLQRILKIITTNLRELLSSRRQPKVVHAFDMADKAGYWWRCWMSKIKFPILCVGSDTKHNEETRDNMEDSDLEKHLNGCFWCCRPICPGVSDSLTRATTASV